MSEKSEILDLIAKYFDNPNDLECKSQIDDFRAKSRENDEFFIETKRLWLLSAQSAVLNTVDQKLSASNFKKRLADARRPRIVKLKNRSYIKWIAASVVVMLVAGLSYFYTQDAQKRHLEKPYASDANPGGNKAILVLADGRKISLTDVGNGDVAKEAGLAIRKTSDGQLVYTVLENEGQSEENTFNTIETPKGGMWQVRLPDGSAVWLNAVSSITYPLSFTKGKKRIVELKGEAYFEVAKDQLHPFVVRTAKQEVEVLGTSFNINSYTDEVSVKTTLLEGSVKIYPTRLASADANVLLPGEQAILTSNTVAVVKVDANDAIDWKNGYFMFNNERQESIMRKIARWYNVQVEYADPLAKEVTYYGSISRFDNVSKILRKFEQTGEVRFEINKNKITVYKEDNN